MRAFLLIVALLLFPLTAEAAGGGGGEKQPDSPSEGGMQVSGGLFRDDPIYLKIDPPLIVPVITDNGPSQIVTLLISLQIKDLGMVDDLRPRFPVFRHNMIEGLYAGFGRGSLLNGQMVDVDKVKARIAAAAERTWGANKIQDVLIQGVAQRKL
jgi:hypothetical protein